MDWRWLTGGVGGDGQLSSSLKSTQSFFPSQTFSVSMQTPPQKNSSSLQRSALKILNKDENFSLSLLQLFVRVKATSKSLQPLIKFNSMQILTITSFILFVRPINAIFLVITKKFWPDTFTVLTFPFTVWAICHYSLRCRCFSFEWWMVNRVSVSVRVSELCSF